MSTVWKLLHETPSEFIVQMFDYEITENPIFIKQFEILFKSFCANKRHSPYIAHIIGRIIREGVEKEVHAREFDSLEFEFFTRAQKSGLLNQNAIAMFFEPIYLDSLLVLAIVFELKNLDQKGDDAIHYFAHNILEILL